MTHMTQESIEHAEDRGRFSDIVTADEARPGLARQLINGFGGLTVLLVTGVVIVLLVLWKSP